MQTKPSEADESDLKGLMQNQYGLRYGNVDLQATEIEIFSEVSLANNKDLSS